jgi:hypothetical protein
MLASHKVMPVPEPGIACGRALKGGIDGPSCRGGAAFHEKPGEHQYAAEEEGPVAQHVDETAGHVTRPQLQGYQQVCEGAAETTGEHEEHHDGPMDGDQRQVHVGVQDTSWCPFLPEEEVREPETLSGHASCKRKITDMITATTAMMIAVTRNCLLIILWSCEKMYFVTKCSSW